MIAIVILWMRTLSLIGCLIFSMVSVLYAENITTKVDRSQLALGEAFELMISTTQDNQDITRAAPNLSALEKDFTVMGTSKRTQLSVVNGVTNRLTMWVITLVPLHEGDITVPSISVGTEKSSPVKVQVLSVAQSAKQKKLSPVFLEVLVDKRAPYVQQAVNYSVRLYFAERLIQGELTDPQAKEALILRVSADKEFQAKREGQLYQVLERHYAIFPQTSGELKIISPQFMGIAESQPNVSQDQFFSLMTVGGKPIRLSVTNEVLQVKPVPLAAKAKPQQPWLPAKKLTLTETWSQPVTQWRVGQPITRTIMLEAEGLSATQLAAIPVSHPMGVNHYSDKAQTDTRLQGDTVVGQRIEKIVYIPTQTGAIEFPAVVLSWWNTELDKLQTTMLADKKINILAAGNNTQQTNAVVTPSSVNSTSPTTALPSTKMIEASQTNGLSPTSPNAPLSLWQTIFSQQYVAIPWVLAGFFLLAWMLTLLLLWYRRAHSMVKLQVTSKVSNEHSNNKARMQAKKQWVKQLKQACFANDSSHVKTCLLGWASCVWPEQTIRGLNDLSQLIGNELQLMVEIERLNTVLYGHLSGTDWSGEPLWHAFSDYVNHPEQRSKNGVAKNKQALPELYLN